MIVQRTYRGFEFIEEDYYPPKAGKVTRLVQQSSAIGVYEDSFDQSGSSYLWIGQDIYLDREQVAELVEHLQQWLRTSSFGGSMEKTS